MKNVSKVIVAFAVSSFVIFSSCSDDEDVTLPPIGGYNNSDEVSAANLVSKLSFENNLTETKANLTGTPTNAAYIAGKKGQAWEGSSTQARYAVFNGATALSTLSSFTFAFWMKSGQTVPDAGAVEQGKGTQGIFSLVNPTGFWGGLNIFLEQNNSNPDTIKVKMDIENKRAGVNWGGQGPIFLVPGAVNQWVHIVLSYDATSSRYSVYKNGALGGINSAWGPYGPYGIPGSFILYGDNPGGPDPTGGYPAPGGTAGSNGNPNSAPLYGAIEFGPTPLTQFVIGSHQFSTTPPLTSGATAQPWATTYAGLLDEFRIYKVALSESEVNSLYQLELAGR